jgi:hypothetical protein
MPERTGWVSRVRQAAIAVLLCAAIPAFAQNNAPSQSPVATPVGDGTFLLTIFLKHDEWKTLPKINEQ